MNTRILLHFPPRRQLLPHLSRYQQRRIHEGGDRVFARSGEAGAKDDNGTELRYRTRPEGREKNSFTFLFVRLWAKGAAEENVEHERDRFQRRKIRREVGSEGLRLLKTRILVESKWNSGQVVIE